jgi:hypothetical protein
MEILFHARPRRAYRRPPQWSELVDQWRTWVSPLPIGARRPAVTVGHAQMVVVA